MFVWWSGRRTPLEEGSIAEFARWYLYRAAAAHEWWGDTPYSAALSELLKAEKKERRSATGIVRPGCSFVLGIAALVAAVAAAELAF